MKATQLRAGMRVLTRGGAEGLVIESKSGLIMVLDRHIEGVCTQFLTQTHIKEGWDEDLLYLLGREGDDRMGWDIMVVWNLGNSGYVCDLSRNDHLAIPQWRRRSRDVSHSEAMKVLKDHYGTEVNKVLKDRFGAEVNLV